MRITKVIHTGNTRYRVKEAQVTDGKRQRKFFGTKEAAEQKPDYWPWLWQQEMWIDGAAKRSDSHSWVQRGQDVI